MPMILGYEKYKYFRSNAMALRMLSLYQHRKIMKTGAPALTQNILLSLLKKSGHRPVVKICHQLL
jgi:hypothetical protein